MIHSSCGETTPTPMIFLFFFCFFYSVLAPIYRKYCCIYYYLYRSVNSHPMSTNRAHIFGATVAQSRPPGPETTKQLHAPNTGSDQPAPHLILRPRLAISNVYQNTDCASNSFAPCETAISLGPKDVQHPTQLSPSVSISSRTNRGGRRIQDRLSLTKRGLWGLAGIERCDHVYMRCATACT